MRRTLVAVTLTAALVGSGCAAESSEAPAGPVTTGASGSPSASATATGTPTPSATATESEPSPETSGDPSPETSPDPSDPSGTGGVSTPDPSAGTTTTAPTTETVTGTNYTYLAPPDWTAAQAIAQQNPGDTGPGTDEDSDSGDESGDEGEDGGDTGEDAADEDSPFDTHIAGLPGRGGFAPNLSVLLAPGGPMDVQDAEENATRELREVGATRIKVGAPGALAGEPAAQVRAVMTVGSTTYRTRQYFVSRGDNGYVLTFSFDARTTREAQDALISPVLASWTWTD